MKLPQELIDEIIGHISLEDKQSLRDCSLVAKSWAHPSQRYLFKVIRLDRTNLQAWLDNISPVNVALLGHVCRLSYHKFPEGVLKPVHIALRDYLPSFHQLRDITLFFSHIPSDLQEIDSFSAFRSTLSTISLPGCTVTKSTFVTLINYFPNLSYINLHSLHYTQEDNPSPPLSKLSFKRLYASEGTAEDLPFFDELLKLGMRFEEVNVASKITEPMSPEFSRSLVRVFGAGASRLRILGSPEGGRSFLSLSHCRELREFEVYAMYLSDPELDLISTITSTKIEKIILSHSPAFDHPVDHAYWRKLDKVLIKLVEKLRPAVRLEVAFRSISSALDEKQDVGKYLPRFVEKGQVVVLDHEYGVLFSSDEGKSLH